MSKFYVTIPYVELSVDKQLSVADNKNDYNNYVIVRNTENEKSIIQIYVNKVSGIIKSFKEFKKVFSKVLSELSITEYTITKIDIVLDTDDELEQEEIKKIQTFIINSDSMRLKADNISTETLFTYTFAGDLRYFGIESEMYRHMFYNKYKSIHNHLIEFNYIGTINNQPITVKSAIDKTFEIYTEIPKYFEKAIDDISEKLYEVYVNETSGTKQKLMTFTEFVTKYSDKITISQVLTALHNSCMGGHTASWLHKYRESRYIYLPKKHDISDYINEYKKALKAYKRG